MVEIWRPVRLLDLGQTVDIPRIEHQRLFANRVGVGAQREPAMRVVQIVRRADRNVVDAFAAPTHPAPDVFRGYPSLNALYGL